MRLVTFRPAPTPTGPAPTPTGEMGANARDGLTCAPISHRRAHLGNGSGGGNASGGGSGSEGGDPRVGALMGEDAVLDLSLADPEIPPDMMTILHQGTSAFDRIRAAIESWEHDCGSAGSALIPRGRVVLDAPVPRPGKIICIGYNYLGHTSADAGNETLPEYPDVFIKTANTIVGSDVPVVVPQETSEADYEAELAVVIGRQARRVDPRSALDYVAGYSIFNDLSARDWQRHGSQWTLGKSFDGFGPFGPALVTADDVQDPQSLDIELTVNGRVTLRGNTAQMIFPVAELVAYVTDAMTLEPGDIIATGTPQKLPDALAETRWLVPGDRVEIAITGLGTLGTDMIAGPGPTRMNGLQVPAPNRPLQTL